MRAALYKQKFSCSMRKSASPGAPEKTAAKPAVSAAVPISSRTASASRLYFVILTVLYALQELKYFLSETVLKLLT